MPISGLDEGSVTPLLKKPDLDATDFKNLRSIINLSTVSKLLERLVVQRLRPQLKSSLNYCVLQSAYRSDRSTVTAIIKVVDDILGHVDTGSMFALISLDISAVLIQ